MSFIIANTASLNEIIFFENYQYDNIVHIDYTQYVNNLKVKIVDEKGNVFQNNGLGCQLIFEYN